VRGSSNRSAVGGSFKMSFTNFFIGNEHSFGDKLLEIKPDKLLKYADKFDNLNLLGEMITSLWLKKVSLAHNLKSFRKAFQQLFL
jgi:hypothetical protein